MRSRWKAFVLQPRGFIYLKGGGRFDGQKCAFLVYAIAMLPSMCKRVLTRKALASLKQKNSCLRKLQKHFYVAQSFKSLAKVSATTNSSYAVTQAVNDLHLHKCKPDALRYFRQLFAGIAGKQWRRSQWCRFKLSIGGIICNFTPILPYFQHW